MLDMKRLHAFLGQWFEEDPHMGVMVRYGHIMYIAYMKREMNTEIDKYYVVTGLVKKKKKHIYINTQTSKV